MKYFITDTHPLVWYFIGSRKLPRKIERIFDQALAGELGIWVPIVALWEASLLEKSGKIRFVKSLDVFVADIFAQSIKMLDLLPQDILSAHALNFSKDPFDTLIVAMAQRIDCPLITGDTLIHAQQPCQLFWD